MSRLPATRAARGFPPRALLRLDAPGRQAAPRDRRNAGGRRYPRAGETRRSAALAPALPALPGLRPDRNRADRTPGPRSAVMIHDPISARALPLRSRPVPSASRRFAQSPPMQLRYCDPPGSRPAIESGCMLLRRLLPARATVTSITRPAPVSSPESSFKKQNA